MKKEDTDPYETYVNGYSIFEAKIVDGKDESIIYIIAKSMEKAVAIAREYSGSKIKIVHILDKSLYVLLQKD